uniref:Integrase catalytic domain-containing protein n=1 Tax=Plectus sambesii TaxID=2011161 RepID=A0A914UGX5_9BILA
MAVTEAEREDLVPQEGPVFNVYPAIHHINSHEDKKSIQDEVLLLSKEVVLSNPANPAWTHKTTAFFDVGSQLSFITTEVAEKLWLLPSNQEKLTISTFGEENPRKVHSNSFEVNMQHAEGTLRMKVSSFKKLTGHIVAPAENRKHSDATSLQGRQVSPGILIGADYFWDVINTSKARKLPSGFNMVDSKVGPMLCGKGHMTSMMAIQKHQDNTSSLDDTIEKFWRLEAIGVKDDPPVDDDDIALQQFQKNVCQKEGRYTVKWPWKEEQPELTSNYFTCVGRLQSTLKRLKEQPDLLQRYNAIMEEQQIKGIIEPVENLEEHGGLVHSLPHHPVLTPNKATTKLRIVYDTSAKAKQGAKSLNDCLYRGPLLTADLCGMLLRFRTYHIAIVADVEKAFLQLGLEKKDHDVVRFLWLKDVGKPWSADNLQVYRFCRVPFGVISSPFLLAATIHHHLQNHGLHQLETDVAREITNNIYADNVLMEAATTEEAKKKCQEAKGIFWDALMNLREFISNDPEVNKKFADVGQKPIVKFLGIPWNTRSDKITMQLPLIEEHNSTTKRHVLQAIASVFDPLGLLAPAIVPAKRFFQELWQKTYNWDQQLSPEDNKSWKKVAQALSDKKLELPRKIYENKEESSLTLHTFVDASAIAYAAAVYLRQETRLGVTVTLLYAKSRLCPIKRITIPRLELMAAVIGSRMTTFIMGQIQKPIQMITLWSDSKCVLGWIHSRSGMLPKFVANRVQEIQKLKMTNFRYVPTKENPADLGSRGITMDELKGNSLWWKGPAWLTDDPLKWPLPRIVNMDGMEEYKVENTELEDKLVASITLQPHPIIIHPDRYSSWQNMLVIMSMVLWLIKDKIVDHINSPQKGFWKWLKRVNNGRRCAETMSLAEEELLRQAQKGHPPEKGEVEGLGFQKDGRGLLICTGRLLNSSLPEEAKRPIYLPRKSRTTELLILHIHQRNFHCGTQHTLAQLRKQYWVPKGRTTVKAAVHKHCMACHRSNATPFALPMMPALPKERVTQAAPFKNTGLDYLGPMMVKNQDSREKLWVCLFTCLVTRAIHLEYVAEMTAEAFISAFRRFIARRGCPAVIISDNAKQFLLAEKTLNKLWSTTRQDGNVINYFAQERIKWKFIPELAPWHGGMYERMVAMVKKAYHAAIGCKLLTIEQFSTLLPEIEAIVNCRPLTYIGEDTTAGRILRPIDFILPHCQPGLPRLEEDYGEEEYKPDAPNTQDKLIKVWNKTLTTLDRFWEIWHADYLTSLRERQQRFHQEPRSRMHNAPQVGEVVLIRDDFVPRGLWRLGKVEEVTTSSDNEIRVAKVKVANGHILRRAINHLYPLEVSEASQELQEDNDQATATKQTSPAKIIPDQGRYNL